MDDHRLAADAAHGDEEALTALVERYRSYVYTIAYRIASDEDDALDIAQNVFLRLYERIGQFSGRGRFRAWLAAIASREALSFLRRAGRRETPVAPEVLEVLADERQSNNPRNPRQMAETAQRKELVESVVARLSPQQRAIFALRVGEDMPPKEIAERLGIPGRQVYTQLHRTIARIRKALMEKGVLET